MLDMDERIEDIDIEVAGLGLYSPEEVHAMIQASVESENRDNPSAHIQLLEMDDLANYLATHQEEGRKQLIIYKGNHYMTADILVQDGTKSCVLLDAANDPRYLAAEDCFNAAGFETHTACGFSFSDRNLQTDVYSCPLFALDHAVQFSHTTDTIHSAVKARSDEINSFPWDVLPPNFLWNMQSLRTRDEYVKHYPMEAERPMHNQISFNTYIEQGLSTDRNGIQRNNSINAHVFDTVELVYIEQQREQALAQMDAKIDEVMAQKKPDNQQIISLCAIRDDLSQSSDLSKNEKLMQRFDVIANPPKTSMFRSAMQYIRGEKNPAHESKKISTSNEESAPSKSQRSGKF